MDLNTLRFAKTHEWAIQDGDIVTVGISKFAVEQLTEPTFLELPKVGKAVKVGAEVANIESVKSNSAIYSPVMGEVIAINEKLIDDPKTKRKADLSLVNTDPLGAGWMFKVKLAAGATLDHLLTKAQYDQQIAGM
jgi:glycine cleavage system H protein